MSDFTYKPPDSQIYMRAILLMATKQGYIALYERLKNARCSINGSTQFSQKRWDGFYTTVVFQVPMEEYTQPDFDDTEKKILLRFCNEAMPAVAGLDVMNVSMSPRLESDPGSKSLEEQLRDIIAETQNAVVGDLPDDLIATGKRMSEAYLFLYAVENYLQCFIEHQGAIAYGEDYFSKLTIPNRVKVTLDSRRLQESKKAWMSVRGDSKLFYLDFKDLGDIIINNWEIFSGSFPSQSWITSKIDELGDCRNLVAHNSVVDEHEIDVIRTAFRSIVRQLNKAMS